MCDKNAAECGSHETPIMYSPSSDTMEMTFDGGLGHCLLDSITEHLFGSNACICQYGASINFAAQRQTRSICRLNSF